MGVNGGWFHYSRGSFQSLSLTNTPTKCWYISKWKYPPPPPLLPLPPLPPLPPPPLSAPTLFDHHSRLEKVVSSWWMWAFPFRNRSFPGPPPDVITGNKKYNLQRKEISFDYWHYQLASTQKNGLCRCYNWGKHFNCRPTSSLYSLELQQQQQ